MKNQINHVNRWMHSGTTHNWVRPVIVIAAILGAIFILVHFWWVFALIALGIAIGVSKK